MFKNMYACAWALRRRTEKHPQTGKAHRAVSIAVVEASGADTFASTAELATPADITTGATVGVVIARILQRQVQPCPLTCCSLEKQAVGQGWSSMTGIS